MNTVKTYLFRIGTPLTAGLFLVSAVSGAALYFGIGPGLFHEMHEVLSMVLLVPIGVHLWKNWRPLTGYFRKVAMPAALALSLAAAGYFAVGSLGSASRGNPAMAFVSAAQSAPISALAPVLKLDAAAAVRKLDAAGFAPVASDETIAAIAARSGRNSFEVMAALTAAPAATAAP